MIRVVIAGSEKAAYREGNRRGVSLKKCFRGKTRGTVYCDAPCGKEGQIVRWYGERVHMKAGRGSPPGTLTFFSTKSCKKPQ